jgi:hypothetical protein
LLTGYGQIIHTLPVTIAGETFQALAGQRVGANCHLPIVAGIARKKLEQETRQKVISRENYIQKPQSKKLKEGHPSF